MSIAEEFSTRVARELPDTPYALTRTPRGFRVGWNLADEKWAGILASNGTRDSISYTVSVNESRRTFRVTDTLRRASWGGSVGVLSRLGASFSIQSGRVFYRRSVSAAIGPNGATVEFVPEQQRRRIVEIGRELGLTKGLPFGVVLGLWLALGGIALGVIVPATIIALYGTSP